LQQGIQLGGIDYLILVIYFLFVIASGGAQALHQDERGFLPLGPVDPGWIAGLRFLSANLGAQEMIGMAASGAKYVHSHQPLLLGGPRSRPWSSSASS